MLPLNAAQCFPEYHPHDRDRLLRFKIKYKFWGTSLEGTRQVYTYTEIITDEVIEEYVNDELLDARENPSGPSRSYTSGTSRYLAPRGAFLTSST